MWGMFRFAIAAAAAACFALPAAAQDQTTYDVKTMNFDLWCQEQANLPASRCDERRPEDEQRFEAFRGKIEKYEIPHLKDKERERDLDKNLLHNDPIDQPLNKDNSAPDPASQHNP